MLLRSFGRSASPTVATRFEMTGVNFAFLAGASLLLGLAQTTIEFDETMAGGAFRCALDTKRAKEVRFNARAKLDCRLVRYEPGTPRA